jgi:zinc transport system substrate-binding protein
MKNLLLICGLILSIASCKNSDKPDLKKTISVSILPQVYFVESIAGPNYKINVMIPPGASPETYEAGFRQLNELSTSDLYLKIGHLSFEDVWMKTLIELNPKMKVFDVSMGIELIEDSHEHIHNQHSEKEILYDPHIWMSVVNAELIAQNSLKALLQVYPEDSVLFHKNFLQLKKDIDKVKNTWFDKKKLLEGKAFIIYHPALSYLANEMDMEQISLEYEGKEPPPSHIQNIIREAETKDIKSIFIQKQFNPDNAKSLAKEINAEIIIIDPLSSNWKEEMMNILTSLTQER